MGVLSNRLQKNTVRAQIALEQKLSEPGGMKWRLPKNAIEFVRLFLKDKAPSDDAIRDNIVTPVLDKRENREPETD